MFQSLPAATPENQVSQFSNYAKPNAVGKIKLPTLTITCRVQAGY